MTYEEGSQLSSIGSSAFQDLDVFGTFGPKGHTVTGTCQFPKGVQSIAELAFAGCKKLKEITIGKKIRSLGKSCFENDRKLKSVMINGKGLKKVGKHCMKGTGHKKYYVPESKVSVYQKLFHDAK